ncbi:L,D-transpeptidase YbiS [Methylomarinovum tepidoasis]|uniref:L,D-transpeptidase YbiS n=1 Tax=Methylomarinovum tepidoasis TaxID=2840183 RepID=A0AAU9CBW8_9GAMM|nr:L,D-transpeptidase [Methylomarinovum sp. IN45]BCX89447.1 L,D-transpeptidase YbiS [Methylomarinovum sp. IN45]
MTYWLIVSIPQQRLFLLDNGIITQEYPVSTARNGCGERTGSGCTPRGWHYVRAKIGTGLPRYAVLVGRRFTGEIYSPQLAQRHPKRDWILSRILWLCGLEPGFNRLGDRDTFRRYIYIHGSPDHLIDGRPGSCGCIRMRNADIQELYDRIEPGARVWITESGDQSTWPSLPVM